MTVNNIGGDGTASGEMTAVPSDVGIMTKMLSNKVAMGVITVVVIALGVALGIVLAKKKIKKGLEM